jgi:Ca2+-binding RTX toxin-like protein
VCFAGNGNDTFKAGRQWQSLYGEGGSDTVDFADFGEAIYAKPDGATWSGSRTGTRNMLIQSTVERVLGTQWADYFSGTNAANTFFGRAGNDTAYGHGGNDMIFGEVGADLIYGGAGEDFLYGVAGNDVLFGDNENGSGGLGVLDVAYVDRTMIGFFSLRDSTTGVERVSW